MQYVYILQSETTGRYYIGCCGDIEIRLAQHNANTVRSTKGRGPYKVIYKENFDNKTDALKREKQIKRYKSGRYFERLISRVPIV